MHYFSVATMTNNYVIISVKTF